MLRLVYVFVSAALAAPLSAFAFGGGNPEYDQCILNSLANSQSNYAARVITNSCIALYKNGALLLPRERAYHVCVLQNVQSVRGAFAVNEILHACRRQNPM
jgi:hypothetical protein